MDDYGTLAKLFQTKTKYQCRGVASRCCQDLLIQIGSPSKKRRKSSSPRKPSPKKKRPAAPKNQQTIKSRLVEKDRLKDILQQKTSTAEHFDEFFQSHAVQNGLFLKEAAVPALDGFEDSLSFATTPCSLAGKSRVMGSLSSANSMMSEPGTNNVTTTELNAPAATKNAENIMYQLRKDTKKKHNSSLRRSCLKRCPRAAALTGVEQRRQVDEALNLLRQKREQGAKRLCRVVYSSESGEDAHKEDDELESNLSTEHC